MRPFLKWAGGKYKSVKRISHYLPQGDRLIEPFVGAGAVFLNTNYSSYLLGDTNADLIQLYRILREYGDDFIGSCSRLFDGTYNTPGYYYILRNTFNRSSNPWHRSVLFVYLNRHCFNGLCRYNAQGQFNVPFGGYKTPYFPLLEMRAFANKARQAEFICGDFRDTLGQAKTGDVVYCDPPFAPLSPTANFVGYAPGGFSDHDHLDIVDIAIKLRRNGITSVISNHLIPFTTSIYADADVLDDFEVDRSIGRHESRRNPATEVLAVFDGSKAQSGAAS